jgi:hypothetical protein
VLALSSADCIAARAPGTSPRSSRAYEMRVSAAKPGSRSAIRWSASAASSYRPSSVRASVSTPYVVASKSLTASASRADASAAAKSCWLTSSDARPVRAAALSSGCSSNDRSSACSALTYQLGSAVVRARSTYSCPRAAQPGWSPGTAASRACSASIVPAAGAGPEEAVDGAPSSPHRATRALHRPAAGPPPGRRQPARAGLALGSGSRNLRVRLDSLRLMKRGPAPP